MRRYDILIVGIGGQGVITLGTLLKLAALRAGVEVTGAERRGGAQREGRVTSHVRYRQLGAAEAGDPRYQAFSGLIPRGGAHLVLALEPLEALRSLPLMNPDTVVVSEREPRVPTAVRLGTAAYPGLGRIREGIEGVTRRVHFVGLEAACRERFGSLRQVNVLALGLAAALGDLPVPDDALLETVRERLPGFEANREAFRLGRELALRSLEGGDGLRPGTPSA